MTTLPSSSSSAPTSSDSGVPTSSDPPASAATLTVSVNGASRDVPSGLTLDRLVATLTTAPSGVAAAVNEAVVPRSRWSGTRLAEGDRIEVLTAVQGG
jgi:sulfur carrier protein